MQKNRRDVLSSSAVSMLHTAPAVSSTAKKRGAHERPLDTPDASHTHALILPSEGSLSTLLRL